MGSGLNKIYVFTSFSEEEDGAVGWSLTFPEPFQIVYNEPPEP